MARRRHWAALPRLPQILTPTFLGAFARWAFQNFPDLLRIEAGVYGGNDGSMKVLERVGFTKEGIRRSAVCKGGIIMDNVMYGLLRQDFDE